MDYKAQVCGWPQRHRAPEEETLAGNMSLNLPIDVVALLLFVNATAIITLARGADSRQRPSRGPCPILSFKRLFVNRG